MSSWSNKLYGKVDEADQAKLDARRKTQKRLAIITISSLILVIVVVSAVLGTTLSKDNHSNGSKTQSLSSSIKAVCDVTLYPDTCYTSLAPLLKSNHVIQPLELCKYSVQVALNELSQALKNGGLKQVVKDNSTLAALESCGELLDLAVDHLNNTLSATSGVTLTEAVDDLMTWLSASGTYQQTCIDSFEEVGSKDNVGQYLKNSTELTSNSLAIIKEVSKVATTFNLKQRRLLSVNVSVDVEGDTPLWVDRRLLEVKKNGIKVDVVVAKDGSGKYKTIKDALKQVPEKSKDRFVIYVKKGVYLENVRIEKTMWNVMMIGDGMYATIVSGSLNVIDGTPTFQSATFAVFGQGFIARDMGFRNTAGPIKHQAVALMSSADLSVFYRCTMDAFQDTLYAHANRQFFRECDIYGTVDFIFGNSAVVFQNCNIRPRKPMQGQQNTITAQGRFDPNQNTGIAIQNCTIYPGGNLTLVSTFLGRPWKNYSTTVFTHSNMGSLIDPKGWLPWIGDSAPSTIFYAEFQNIGPGSSKKNRVKWKGLRNITPKQASKFTVKPFINGDKWIPATGVAFNPGL